MDLRYPIIDSVLRIANDYAEKSENFTVNIQDFKNSDDYERYRQRFIGQCVQMLYAELFRINEIEVECDDSHYTVSDSFDLKLHSCIFDCKGSRFDGAPMQVPAYQKNKDVDFYLYGTLDITGGRWTPHGFVKKDAFFSDDGAQIIQKGEIIPHMNRKNKMDSYFLPLDSSLWYPWERLLGEQSFNHIFSRIEIRKTA